MSNTEPLPLPEALAAHLNEFEKRLAQHSKYGTEIWAKDRETFFTILRPQIPRTRCKACGGIGHGVQHKCASNKLIDGLLKNWKGPFKSMWAAIKTANTDRGPRINALSTYKGNQIAEANLLTKA